MDLEDLVIFFLPLLLKVLTKAASKSLAKWSGGPLQQRNITPSSSISNTATLGERHLLQWSKASRNRSGLP